MLRDGVGEQHALRGHRSHQYARYGRHVLSDAWIARLSAGPARRAGTRETRLWMLLAWAAMGLAFLSKGLIGLVLPAAAMMAYALVQRDLSFLKRLEPVRRRRHHAGHCAALDHRGVDCQPRVSALLLHPRTFPALPDASPSPHGALVVFRSDPDRRHAALDGNARTGADQRMEGRSDRTVVQVAAVSAPLCGRHFPVLQHIAVQAAVVHSADFSRARTARRRMACPCPRPQARMADSADRRPGVCRRIRIALRVHFGSDKVPAALYAHIRQMDTCRYLDVARRFLPCDVFGLARTHRSRGHRARRRRIAARSTRHDRTSKRCRRLFHVTSGRHRSGRFSTPTPPSTACAPTSRRCLSISNER